MKKLITSFSCIKHQIVLGAVLITNITNKAVADGIDAPNEPVSKIYDGPISQNPIYDWIQFGVNTLTVLIIAGSAVMIAVAGIQYMTARDNSQAVQSAKERITMVISGLLMYMFLYAFVQWLVPGGIF